SLAGLQKAVLAAKTDANAALPEELRFLAGLQRIEYVFVNQEEKDIIIAGPAQAWEVRQDGAVVGKENGLPVLLLDDLLTVMASMEKARGEGITCSIEPTAEGRQRLQRLLSTTRLRPGMNPRYLEPQMRQAFGPQMIKLTGVPSNSHFARTMVAADFQMKRLAMNLEEAPVRGLPSYLDISKNNIQSASANPRWWMACDYDALERNANRTAWKLTGQGIKTMTETDLIAEDGTATASGKTNPRAQKWADLMTQRFGELASKTAVFGELRAIMDLTVLATLIEQEGLESSAGCDLSELRSLERVEPASLPVPRAVSPQCSFIRGGSQWVVTASGGVDASAFTIVQSQKENADVEKTMSDALDKDEKQTWWW
ncbi:MAG: DUF1598 domain-containing protein, partial [Planctomycetota bacterium]